MLYASDLVLPFANKGSKSWKAKKPDPEPAEGSFADKSPLAIGPFGRLRNRIFRPLIANGDSYKTLHLKKLNRTKINLGIVTIPKLAFENQKVNSPIRRRFSKNKLICARRRIILEPFERTMVFLKPECVNSFLLIHYIDDWRMVKWPKRLLRISILRANAF